jgi:hypothetical protein
MKFITSEDFLKQPTEVQKVLLDWWKPMEGDLLFYPERKDIFMNELDNTIIINTVDEKCNPYLKAISKKDAIPLLTEGQLRQFIEDKTSGISSINIKCNNIKINIYDNNLPIFIKKYEDLGSNLLQAYWKVAIQISKGVV